MKRVLLILSIVIIANDLKGQTGFGIKVGATQSNMNYYFGDHKIEDVLDITRPEISLFANFPIKKALGITTNFTYYTKGADFPELVIWDFNAVEISSTLNLTKSISNIHISGFLGLAVSHITNWYEERPNQDKRKLDIDTEEVNRTELSLPVGFEVGYIFNNITIFTEIKFRTPITKLIDEAQTENFSISGSNKSKSLSLGIRYTLSTKE